METNKDLALSEEKPNFRDIRIVNNVAFMHIRYNLDAEKNEWLCLEIPDKPMIWDDGLKWCRSKGCEYTQLSILRFISEYIDKINEVLQDKGYPLLEEEDHWSTELDEENAYTLLLGYDYCNQEQKDEINYVRVVISI